jgi:hypothetical protein
VGEEKEIGLQLWQQPHNSTNEGNSKHANNICTVVVSLPAVILLALSCNDHHPAASFLPGEMTMLLIWGHWWDPPQY